MKKPAVISKSEPQFRSLDYKALFREGIELIQKYSGETWTDFNEHDPGVTMLEYLCFGITDIGYRSNFPISDLLYSPERRNLLLVNNAFFSPEKILPCLPLTKDDYKRLIIDQMKEVSNVWMELVTDKKDAFGGLYDIRLQLSENNKPGITPEEVGRWVRKRFTENRNLCEDIREVHILKPQFLEIEANVQIDIDASPEQVLADIILHLKQLLTPSVQFTSLEEMLAKGINLGELLDGPLPHHGFVKPEDFQPIVSRLNLPQIIDVIVAVNDVLGIVGEVSIKIDGLSLVNNEILLPENTYLILKVDDMLDEHLEQPPIVFFRNELTVTPNIRMVKQILGSYHTRDSQYFNQKIDLSSPYTTSQKDIADIGAYYSIQHFFPAVYGIGPYGLPRDADFRRQARARQLKGYLAIFETLLASYLSQLTHIKQLFSIGEMGKDQATEKNIELKINDLNEDVSDKIGPSYFAQFPFDIPDIGPLLNSVEQSDEAAKIDIQQKITSLNAINDMVLDRRNEFLDHLLARFGEKVQGDLLNHHLDTPAEATLLKKNMINTKCRILQEYETISRDRGKGFDYLQKDHVQDKNIIWAGQSTPTTVSYNVSGLKKRLCAWLNLQHSYDRYLTDFFPFDALLHEQSTVEDATMAGKVSLSALIRYGKKETSYHIQKTGKKGWEIAFLGKHDEKEQILFRFGDIDERQAKESLKQFIDSITAFDEYSKGLFVVEHLLLRPTDPGGKRLLLSIPGLSLKNAFVSLSFQSQEILDNLAEGLLGTASRKENYALLKESENYFVVLMQDNRPILISTQSYTKKEAEAFRDKVVSEMNLALEGSNTAAQEGNSRSINDYLEFNFESAEIKGSKIDHFYACRLSIVLPDWPSKFMEQGFRIQMEHLVAQHVPAHIRADLKWLDWSEMRKFEKLYFDWLKAKSSDEIGPSDLDDLSFQMVQLLLAKDDPAYSKLEKFRQQEADQKKEMESYLSKARLNALLDKFGYNFLFSPTDLQIIDGIDTGVEFWLKNESISTWSLLSVANDTVLQKICQKTGRPDSIADLKKWKQQALYAAKNQWSKLKKYQKELYSEKLLTLTNKKKKDWGIS